MVRSLLVILVPLVLITWFFSSNPGDHPVTAVDWRPALTQARAEAPYEVLAPTNLPEGWVPTRVSWIREGQTGAGGGSSLGNDWTIGYLSPDEVYFGLRQSDAEPARVIADVSRKGKRDGASQLGSTRWERYVSPDDRTRSLVLRASGVTTVVVADAPYAALDAFAATLRADG